MLKKILFAFLASLFLVSCSSNTQPSESSSSLEQPSISDVMGDIVSSSSTVTETAKTKLELLSEETGLKSLNRTIYDMDNNFTITYQREFIGNKYLLNIGYFNIAEYGNKIILHDDGMWELYYISLTESQLEQLLTVEPSDSVIISFEVESVQPVATHWSPETEVSGFDAEVYDNDASSVYIDQSIVSENVSSYISGSGRYSSIYGKCLDILSIEKLSYE